jgi:hypothetical protein
MIKNNKICTQKYKINNRIKLNKINKIIQQKCKIKLNKRKKKRKCKIMIINRNQSNQTKLKMHRNQSKISQFNKKLNKKSPINQSNNQKCKN